MFEDSMDHRIDITIIGLFPKIVEIYMSESIPARTISANKAQIRFLNIREFAQGTRRTCDDEPYGGGAGMVLKPEPIAAALECANYSTARVVIPTPTGNPFTQEMALQFSHSERIIFIAGRYEGIDQRVMDLYATDEVSVGDYVMFSGELACLVIVDTMLRLLDGAITCKSLVTESYQDNLLEYPHYTRPRVFKGSKVPQVLLSGDHARIAQWRKAQQIARTKVRRPDLYKKFITDSKR